MSKEISVVMISVSHNSACDNGIKLLIEMNLNWLMNRILELKISLKYKIFFFLLRQSFMKVRKLSRKY
jgi:phosphomannomutase